MQINFPSPEQAAITLANQAATIGIFSYGKFIPLKITKKDIALNGFNYMGVPTLTSLAFQYKGKPVELIECVITINQEKNIVTTALEGRDGTVKEYISDGDYVISVEAAVSSYSVDQNQDVDASSSQEYPISQLEDILDILRVKDTVSVQSDFLNLFDITSVVVKSYVMVQETHSNRQAFTIQMLSDLPYEIKMQQDANIK